MNGGSEAGSGAGTPTGERGHGGADGEEGSSMAEAQVNLANLDAKGRHPKKNTGFFGNFSQRGGGSSQFPKLLQINQVIFGMPKSFLGAKTCFTIVGR